VRLWSKFGRPIEPFYPDVSDAGRPPNGLALVLRMYVLQQSFGLSDEGIEDTVDNSQAIGASVGIYLGRGAAPHATGLSPRHVH
jgi:IS5 family transposase